jgi:hypothetical protein
MNSGGKQSYRYVLDGYLIAFCLHLTSRFVDSNCFNTKQQSKAVEFIVKRMLPQ